jgi:hypothetical protein
VIQDILDKVVKDVQPQLHKNLRLQKWSHLRRKNPTMGWMDMDMKLDYIYIPLKTLMCYN